MDLLDAILASAPAQVAAAAIDWEIYARSIGSRRNGGFLSRLRVQAAPDVLPPAKTALRDRIAEAAAGERPGVLRTAVVEAVWKVIGLGEGGEVRTDRPLMEQGLDSLMSVELRNMLSAALGVPLPVGLLFNYPSVDDLCRHLAELLKIDPVALAAGKDGSPAGNVDEFAYLDDLAPEELDELIRKEIG